MKSVIDLRKIAWDKINIFHYGTWKRKPGKKVCLGLTKKYLIVRIF